MGNFYVDTIKSSRVFASVDVVGDRALLEPKTLAAVDSIIKDAAAYDLTLMVYETYRSRERQQKLFEQGATKLRTVGVHHYGLACDIVKSINGKPSWKGDFSLLGQLAHQYGLIWGGDWGSPGKPHTFIDSVHVQRCSLNRQSSLFKESWYPDDSYNPYDDT